MTLPIRTTSATLLLAMTLTGCTTWKRDDAVLLQPIPERAKIGINANGMRVVAHGVRVDSQGVSYVKIFQDPACDSCRAAVPLASIDSVRVSTVSALKTVTLLTIITAIMLYFGPYMASDVPYT